MMLEALHIDYIECSSVLLRRFLAWVTETFLSDKLFAATMRMSKVKSFRDVMRLANERDKFRECWYEKVHMANFS
jgi:hypothetical protein